MEKYGTVGIDGFELAYRVEGEGTPILVVGSRMYYPRLFSEELRNKFQWIFIDHRGFVKPPGAVSAEQYALETVVDDIEKIRQHLGLEQVVMLGHSGHAFLALEYAIKYPERVRELVLLNSAPSNSEERQRQSLAYFAEHASPDRKRKFEQDIAGLASDIEREPDRRFVHLLIRMGAHSFYDYNFDSGYLWQDVYTNMQIIDHLWGEAFAKLDMMERLAYVRMPVLLGLGSYDYLVAPLSLWDRVEERYQHVNKVVFEHSGHNPMLEEPERFDSVLVGWLNQENRAAAFGGRIKQLRRQQELTLRKLSEKAGISYSLSHAIERGELLPTEEAVLSIARALGQHKPDELLALAGYGREQGKAD